MPQSIFDLVTSQEIAAYWETLQANLEGLLGDELWPSKQKLGLDLKYVKGSKGLPVVLKPSAYDVVSMKRDRIGFEKVSMEMPFFKEAMYIDEELRQQLNMVLETGNQAYIDSIINRIFADNITLLEGARAQRERMKMMLLTSGAISISANGQNYDYDYGMPENHKGSASVSWNDPTADIIGDIRSWQDTIEEDTGVRPSRGVCGSKVITYMLKNDAIRNAIWGNDASAPVSRTKLFDYLLEELNLSIAVNSKKYKDETGADTQYIPDDMISLFSTGALGDGWFGTTPEQSDLMSGSAANVSIVDTGVAVTTVKVTDPVNVDTKVSMIFLPSFPTIDQLFIADVII